MSRYLEQCCLVNPTTKQVVQPAPLSNEKLDALCACCQTFDLELVGGVSNPMVDGAPSDTLDSEVPVLVHVVLRGTKTYIQYVLFYAYNGATAVLGGALWMGQHQADLENVTAEVEDGELKGYYLSHHGEETFYRVDELELREQRHVIYVARGSHANYPRAQAYRRFYG